MDPITLALIGGAAAGGMDIFGKAIGNIFGWDDDTPSFKEQVQAQKDLTDYTAATNFKYSEQGAINAIARDTETYQKFQSPEAMVQQYKDANLNPALMYGHAQSQGGTIQQSAAGTPAGQSAASIAQMAQVAQQQQMQSVQRATLMSEAIKNIAGAELTKAEKENALQELGLKKATYEADILKADSEAKIAKTKAWLDNEIKEAQRNISWNKSRQEDTFTSKTQLDLALQELYQKNKVHKDFVSKDSAAYQEYKQKKTIINQQNEMYKIEKALRENQRDYERGKITIQEQEKREAEARANAAKELYRIQIEAGNKGLTEAEYKNKMLVWAYENRNLFKTLDVVQDLTKTAVNAFTAVRKARDFGTEKY